MVESAYATAAQPDRVHLRVLVDRDDPATAEYVLRQRNVRVLWRENPETGPHLARMYNALYATQDPAERLVSMVGDDMEFRTQGWDSMVLDEVNRHAGWALVYGDDDYVQHGRMAVHFFTTRRVVTATGREFMWERWRANIIDYVWTEVAHQAGILRYLPAMHIAHLHSARNPDETYKRMTPHRQFASGKYNGVITAYVEHTAEVLKREMTRERN
jgi:hypothetical protein